MEKYQSDILKAIIYFYKEEKQYNLLLLSNRSLKEQIIANDWIVDTFLTATERSYIYKKGRMVERIGARIAAKFSYLKFNPNADFQLLSIVNDNNDVPFLVDKNTRLNRFLVSLTHTENYSGAMIMKE
ncbi:hypothetical protein CAI16_16510 [Virgibacillus dokdonensis]|uniref:4'-phosphopantetheinyl transferase domain-containing protein n=1 Tax=Virgibacillus dokdonensis TaxID=302167 RepID=A0A3E0WLZ1_9BACI|nr:hypothetical protein [Virgibacillus dokdonensis]RFA32965.1 hypothetical protein CAI16_16510 [Virgibacillus dokdonensis]